MSSAIFCEQLTAGYEGVPVVRGLDLFVEPGEVVALLGPNGAGKTTILNVVSGVLEPIGGSVQLLDERVKAGQPHLIARRGLAHVPDDRSLFFGLSVRENLRLGCRKSKRREAAASIRRALEYFPVLADMLDRRAGLLSGGEQQMLALGRALMNSPKVLMIDEMSLGLAPVIVEQLLPITRKVAEDLGTAVLLVEQHVDLALQVADRAYVINHGELLITDTAEVLAGRPDLLEASYLGEVAFDAIDADADGDQLADRTELS
jgi:branched-chain amino acid transport system ATP-binding protein